MANKDWPARLWIVRHGQSAGNVARDAAEAGKHDLIELDTRDADVPLSDLGHQQASALSRRRSSTQGSSEPARRSVTPVLVGVGMESNLQSARVAAMAAQYSKVPLILDAGALAYARHEKIARPSRCVLTPQAGEMATLSGHSKKYVENNTLNVAVEQQKRLGTAIDLRWAVAWAVYLHGRAGHRLAARIGPVGFLAREVADELPATLVASGQR